jgi:hypothetical protein
MQTDWRSSPVEHFWEEAEENTALLLRQHSREVEAIALALLEKGDLSGKEVLEIILQVTAGNGKGEEVSQALALTSRTNMPVGPE